MPEPLGFRRGEALQLARRDSAFAEHFPTFGHTDCIPTAADIVAAKRLTIDQEGDLLLIRVRTPALAALGGIAFEEYLLRDPKGHAGVAGGWMLWARRTVALGRVWRWMVGTIDQDRMPNASFALRIGPAAAAYASGGEGPDFAYTGFGHGRMTNVPANNVIILDGAGANLQPLANWPVGTVKRGDALSISCNYKLKYFDNVTQAVNLDYAQYFGVSPIGPTYGVMRVGTFNALIAGVAMQDSYGHMLPASPFHVDRFKPSGFAAIPITGDGAQKPVTYPSPWNTGASLYHQAYHSSDPRLVETLDISRFAKPLRRKAGGADIAAWERNLYGRYFFRDLTADSAGHRFPKYYVFLMSSQEAAPRTAFALPQGETWEWSNVLESRYFANGVPL